MCGGAEAMGEPDPADRCGMQEGNRGEVGKCSRVTDLS